jgi:hypothetical protein
MPKVYTKISLNEVINRYGYLRIIQISTLLSFIFLLEPSYHIILTKYTSSYGSVSEGKISNKYRLWRRAGNPTFFRSLQNDCKVFYEFTDDAGKLIKGSGSYKESICSYLKESQIVKISYVKRPVYYSYISEHFSDRIKSYLRLTIYPAFFIMFSIGFILRAAKHRVTINYLIEHGIQYAATITSIIKLSTGIQLIYFEYLFDGRTYTASTYLYSNGALCRLKQGMVTNILVDKRKPKRSMLNIV